MTVNELIAELQVLSAQGHGEVDVCVQDDDGDMVTHLTVIRHSGRYYDWKGGEYQSYSKLHVEVTLD